MLFCHILGPQVISISLRLFIIKIWIFIDFFNNLVLISLCLSLGIHFQTDDYLHAKFEGLNIYQITATPICVWDEQHYRLVSERFILYRMNLSLPKSLAVQYLVQRIYSALFSENRFFENFFFDHWLFFSLTLPAIIILVFTEFYLLSVAKVSICICF